MKFYNLVDHYSDDCFLRVGEAVHVIEYDSLDVGSTCRVLERSQNFSRAVVAADLGEIYLNQLTDEVRVESGSSS